MDYLIHHGVKGQKWGVRRYQNSDGSLTEEGKRRAYINKTNKYVEEIESTLSYDDKKKLGYADPNKPKYTIKEASRMTVKRFIEKVGKEPIGYLDIQADEDEVGRYTNIVIAVKNDEKYRGKGYGKILAKKGSDWVKNSMDINDNFWGYRIDNIQSAKLAEYSGYKINKDLDYTDKEGHTWRYAILKK